MCWTCISYNNQEINNSVILHAINEQARVNNDGYAYRAGNRIVRTLDLDKFFREIKNEKPHVMHIHMRKSTNIISDKYIHLWAYDGITFAHNGVIHNVRHQNDSLGIWEETKKLFDKMDIENIKKKFESYNGYGVFTILYPDDTSMLISINKSIKITRINDGIMFSSDRLDFNSENIETVIKTGYLFKGFSFEKTKREKHPINYNINNLQIDETAEENCILIVDKDGSLIEKIDLEIKSRSYDLLGNNNWRLYE